MAVSTKQYFFCNYLKLLGIHILITTVVHLNEFFEHGRLNRYYNSIILVMCTVQFTGSSPNMSLDLGLGQNWLWSNSHRPCKANTVPERRDTERDKKYLIAAGDQHQQGLSADVCRSEQGGGGVFWAVAGCCHLPQLTAHIHARWEIERCGLCWTL